MKAWLVELKAIGKNDIWTKSRFSVVVGAVDIKTAVARARAWGKKESLTKVEILSANVAAENYA